MNTLHLDWYVNTFVTEPARGYALFNPAGHENKYIKRGDPITPEFIRGALNGETRRTRAGDNWQTVPCSYAVVPQTTAKAPQARSIAMDIDTGGMAALSRVLAVCAAQGVPAFAQRSESAAHDGGHVWIVCEDWQPASLLQEIAKRLALAAGVEAETYPTNVEIRLPLMTHVRAPGGPKRFPLILQDGTIVDAGDAWSALATLHEQFQTVPTIKLTELLETLPSLPVGGGRLRRHSSKVTPSNLSSVIAWYNANYPLRDLLEDAGAEFKHENAHLVCCPFHDDQSPSLAIWRHSDSDKGVCHCFSRGSSCPAAEGVYLDAFDVYRLREGLSASEAVKRLVELHQLGRKREFIVEETPQLEPAPDALELHNRLITKARGQLVNELVSASHRRGEITIIRATPGLGKTHAAAEQANRLQAQGLNVAIIAPTLAVAENEWLPRLKSGHVWRSKVDLCTCEEKSFLQACIKFGFAYPKCKDSACPYCTQAQAAFGKVIIYQHNHLAISEFAQVDVIIVDESPMAALLPEHTVTVGMLAGFVRRHPTDAATPLLQALHNAAQSLPDSMTDTRCAELVTAIEAHLDGWTLDLALDRARHSKFNVEQPAPPELLQTMAPQFLAGLINGLTDNLPGFSYGKSTDGKWGYTWHERKIAALQAYNSLNRPAVIVLDGSANEHISRCLYEPWPVNFTDIDCPVSPLVEVSQITCTASTRHVVREDRLIKNLADAVAVVCTQLGVKLDGGISYQGATAILQETLGGHWLHYGGQRGSNDLADASAIAIVASPTTPPAALERKCLALWPDTDCTWQRAGTTGLYNATDGRLQAMNQLHALEELRQSVYRARPLTATKPMNLLIFTPWDLDAIGIQPNRVVSALPHGSSTEAKKAVETYQASTILAATATREPISIVYKNSENLPPTIENASRVAITQENLSYSRIIDNPPPLSAPIEVPARPIAPNPLARPAYVPAVGDVITQFGKKIYVDRIEAEKVFFNIVDLGREDGRHWLPVASFVAQVQASAPKIERAQVGL